MKKYIYCALIALLALSCDKSEEPWEDSWDNIPVVIHKTLYAQSPIPDVESRAVLEDQPISWDGSETVDSRTYAVVDPDNASAYIQNWSERDAISVFCTTQNLQYQMLNYKDGTLDVGKFELVGEEVSGTQISTEYIYSIYPYKETTTINKKGVVTYNFPETQHYNADSYANGENGMISIKSKDDWNNGNDWLYFKNFCSYLQLRLATNEREPKTVKKITLIANDNTDAISGEGTIEITSEESDPSVKMKRSALSQVTLDCGSGVELSQNENDPTKFWFVLPGGFKFTQGFSITVIFDDYSYFKQSTSKQIAIQRNHIKPMATFKPTQTQATGAIRYKYNNTSIEQPLLLTNSFYGVDGLPLDIIDQIYDSELKEWTVLLSGQLKSIGDNSFEDQEYDIEYITINNGNESIILNDFAFYGCTADYITINNDVDEINKSAFSGSTIKDININGKVTTIKNGAGSGSNIENIIITKDVGTIEDNAFSSSNLKTINVGSVETIGYRAFYTCSNLETVIIPGVKNIGIEAFHSCTKLTNVSLMSVITIDDSAFMNCSNLEFVEISASCTMIGEGAFCDDVKLQTVYCYAKNPPFIKTDNYKSSYAFNNTHSNIHIYIPAGSEERYIDDTWFLGQTFDDEDIEAEVNWWYEEYGDLLYEMTSAE